MNEKPIIFSGQMVLAILTGKKTQTRRVVQPQPMLECGNTSFWRWRDSQWADGGLGVPESAIDDYAPYRVRDSLWVRETWGEMEKIHTGNPFICYKADGEPTNEDGFVFYGWRSPIHMPRRASRIKLIVTGVRMERLQEMTSLDAAKEGFGPYAMLDPREDFRACWDFIHEERGDGWNANPWVWVIDFKRTPEVQK
jgi:hypothetical protein